MDKPDEKLEQRLEKNDPDEKEKKCLVISPFGEEGTDVRKRSDEICNYVIKKVTTPLGYKTYRTIDLSKPGFISSDLMKSIYEADLVIADITDHNPNVFYELALRHSVAKPIIHIGNEIKDIPFDIADAQVIQISSLEPSIIDSVQGEIKRQVEAIEMNNIDFNNPASKYRSEEIESEACDCLSKAYEWEIQYYPKFARTWLELQDEAMQNLADRFRKDDTRLPENPILMNKLAEWLAYRQTQGQRVRGNLFFVINEKLQYLEGWGILKIQTNSIPLAIEISGEKLDDGKYIIKFDQPEQNVTIPPNIDEKIRAFSYEIEFIPNQEKNEILEGILYHPDHVKDDERSLMLADTKLRPMI